MATNHHLRRNHGDPYWSGRLVEGSEHGWDYEDCTTDHLIEQLEDALEHARLVQKSERTDAKFEGHGIVHQKAAWDLAWLFETVDNLQRYLPWVDAWCVGYDGKDSIFRPITAHLDYYQAENYKPYVQALMSSTIEVKIVKYPVPILMIMNPNADPKRFVADIVID